MAKPGIVRESVRVGHSTYITGDFFDVDAQARPPQLHGLLRCCRGSPGDPGGMGGDRKFGRRVRRLAGSKAVQSATTGGSFSLSLSYDYPI